MSLGSPKPDSVCPQASTKPQDAARVNITAKHRHGDAGVSLNWAHTQDMEAMISIKETEDGASQRLTYGENTTFTSCHGDLDDAPLPTPWADAYFGREKTVTGRTPAHKHSRTVTTGQEQTALNAVNLFTIANETILSTEPGKESLSVHGLPKRHGLRNVALAQTCVFRRGERKRSCCQGIEKPARFVVLRLICRTYRPWTWLQKEELDCVTTGKGRGHTCDDNENYRRVVRSHALYPLTRSFKREKSLSALKIDDYRLERIGLLEATCSLHGAPSEFRHTKRRHVPTALSGPALLTVCHHVWGRSGSRRGRAGRVTPSFLPDEAYYHPEQANFGETING
ncbi:hypothetical protein Bbelb_235920 [Branchiostoma belcheri]|nr:hypothetical protein Bbelb_235920 [Branchiostoma belcheri]